MTTLRKSLLVGIVGLLLSAGLATRVLAQYDWDPTIFASFGEQAVAITGYAEKELDRDVIARDTLGHDGKYFFILANDPLLLAPEEHAHVMDRPRYRAQRILYPMLASAFGLFTPDFNVWSLVAVNVLAMGFGTFAVAQLASDMGASPWWGLSFVLNIGFVSEQNIDGAGVLAAATAFAAVLLLRRRKPLPAIALLSLAALSREAMLLVAAGSSFWLWRYRRERSSAVRVVGVPVLTVVLWALYVRLRLGFETAGSEIQEIGLPLVGLVQAFGDWISDPVDLAAGSVIALLLLVFGLRVLSSDELVGWAMVGFVPLAFVFTRQVWSGYFDISRAVAPAITAYVLVAFASTGRSAPSVEAARSG